MSLILNYIHDSRVYLTQQEYEHAAAWVVWKRNYQRDLIQAAIVLAAASYAAYEARIITLLVIFLILVFLSLFRLVRSPRTYVYTLNSMVKKRPTKNVQLVVEDDGLHETVEGIKSYVPWSSIINFGIFKDVLFIKLNANLWAMIPRYGLDDTSATLDQLIEVLRKKGISEREDTKSA